MTWTEIYPGDSDVDGPAVVGIPAEFAGAAAFFESMETAAQDVVTQFEQIESAAGVEELQGKTATAFAALVGEVKETLVVLPRVSGEAAGFLSDHVSRLSELRERSEEGVYSALARARASWDRKQTAERSVEVSTNVINGYVREMNSRAAGEVSDYDEARIQQLTHWIRLESSKLRGHSATVAEEKAALEAIRQEWIGNRAEEERLSNALDDAINAIKLGDLSDPGRLESVLGGLLGLVYELPIIGSLVEAAVAGVRAIADGNFGEFLWQLSSVLGDILTVLGTIALIVLIVAGGPFTWLTIAIITVAAAKLLVDTALYASQTPNPATGEPMGHGTYAFNAVSSILTIATAGFGGSSGWQATSRGAFNSTGAISSIGFTRGTATVAAAASARPIATVLATTSEALTVFGAGKFVFDHAPDAVGGLAGPAVDIAIDSLGPFLGPTGTTPSGVDFDFDIDIPGIGSVIPDPTFNLPRPVIVDIAVDIALPSITSIDVPTIDVPTIDVSFPGVNVPVVSIPAIDIPSILIPSIDIPDFDFGLIAVGD